MGDVWFGGRTRTPWNPDQGSSGSSAGSAAAAAAGAVVFALGTETLGSIVSPSRACGTSALRPTFGRVSRHGAMALSWTMDKVGPIARSADDCHWVMEVIGREDDADPSVVGPDYSGPPPEDWDLAGLRVGIPVGAFEEDDPSRVVLEELEGLGAALSEIELPDLPAGDLLLILEAEAACAFDELTNSGRDDELVRQSADAWPNTFRAARLIPAVEYLRAQRLRGRLMRAMHPALADVDVIVHPPYAAGVLTITNLTGHPTFVAPCGFRENGLPRVICLTGQLFDDERLLALGAAWQAVTEYENVHPDPSGVRPASAAGQSLEDED
jgi:Asp-tRNA(Asn)/Glu-tRNA(Gln) amidotransferase A subunit family amidase